MVHFGHANALRQVRKYNLPSFEVYDELPTWGGVVIGPVDIMIRRPLSYVCRV